jgi:23S rRNA pseudouridine1911/1915/1917 synthase
MNWYWTVPNETGGTTRADLRILDALDRKLGKWELAEGDEIPLLTRSQIQRLISEGRAWIGEHSLKANSKLSPGQVIKLEVPLPKKMSLQPEDRPLEILFQDEHLVVVNKPPGLTVHPSPTQTEGTLVHVLLHHIRDLSGIGGTLRPGIVHRIDKDTSGALVVTKTDLAHTRMVETFAKHEIDRVYWALCFGADLGQEERRIETLIGRNPQDRKKMSSQVKSGRKAITRYKTLERYAHPNRSGAFASLVEARLETGRTHQVRVHLTGAGISLLGDPVYGTPSQKQAKWLALPEEIRERVGSLPGQALHARILGFTHPVSGKKIYLEAEPPSAFHLLLQALRRYL